MIIFEAWSSAKVFRPSLWIPGDVTRALPASDPLSFDCRGAVRCPPQCANPSIVFKVTPTDVRGCYLCWEGTGTGGGRCWRWKWRHLYSFLVLSFLQCPSWQDHSSAPRQRPDKVAHRENHLQLFIAPANAPGEAIDKPFVKFWILKSTHLI